MVFKVLIFVLLGSILVIAETTENSVEQKTEKVPEASTKGVIEETSTKGVIEETSTKGVIEEPSTKGVIEEAHECINGYLEECKRPFEDALNELKQRGEKAVGMNMKNWIELKDIYNQINRNAREGIEERKEVLEASLDDLKKVGIDTTEAGKKKIEELHAEAKKSLVEHKLRWDAQLNAWKELAKNVIQSTKDKGAK